MSEISRRKFLAGCSVVVLANSLGGTIPSAGDAVHIGIDYAKENSDLTVIQFLRIIYEQEGEVWLPHHQKIAEWHFRKGEKSFHHN